MSKKIRAEDLLSWLLKIIKNNLEDAKIYIKM